MRVKFTGYYQRLNGLLATIVEINKLRVGLEFDINIEGHECCNTAKEGHGWYADVYDITPIENNNIIIRKRWYNKGKLENFNLKSFRDFDNL
jgi:hypothetical protein